MQRLIRLAAVATFFSALSVFASETDSDAASSSWFKPIFSLTGEYVAEETYVGDADVKRGNREVQGFSESDNILRFVLTPRIKVGVLRIGAEWERFSFGMPNASPLPNTLQSANLILGLDTQVSDSILIRIEAEPGYYGTNKLNADSVNVPVIAGGTYIYNPDLQFIVGISIDAERKYPVIPAAGIRWKLSREWVVNAVLPEPRLEYEATSNLTLYIGANVKETSFRVDDEFGDAHGKPELNNAVLTYSEVRAGAGADWKLSPIVTLSAEAGYQPYRAFDFYRADVRFHENGSAAYGMISLHGAF